MTYTFIVNPAAGRGRFTGEDNPISRAARKIGIDFRMAYTQFARHATALAATADTDVVVAVGGDGTIHEVVSGIVQSDRMPYLGIVPAGTGNDFAKMFDLPRNVESLVATMATTEPRPIDYGRVVWSAESGDGRAVFANIAGVGIDAKVSAAAAGFKMLRGTPRYLAAVLRTLRSWEAPHLRIRLVSSGLTVLDVEEEILLALMGNGRCAAGGFYLTPDASILDGHIDACVVRTASVGRILSIIPRVLRGGGHGNEPEVTLEAVDTAYVDASTPIPVQADGEILVEDARSVRFEVVAGGLSVVLPVKS